MTEFAADVRHYLTQIPRQLPSRYLYDALGSALFDAICRLPWYHVTRAETGLLGRHGREILDHVDHPSRIVELGGGNGEKLSLLLSARNPASAAPVVHLVDVSPAALETAAQAIGRLDHVSVVTHHARYMAWLDATSRDSGTAQSERTLLLFLGSNIGNFDPPAAEVLLDKIRKVLSPGDHFLLGADLVKPSADLLLAYDDPLGVTAAFNKNLLVRINRELDANFETEGFRHAAVWNAAESRIEIHLVSTRRQQVRVPGAGLDLTLEADETIWTESSYKYRPDDIAQTLERCGFQQSAQWLDAEAGFALMLASVPA
jgi:dimethylhistidine N-methyltransferase